MLLEQEFSMFAARYQNAKKNFCNWQHLLEVHCIFFFSVLSVSILRFEELAQSLQIFMLVLKSILQKSPFWQLKIKEGVRTSVFLKTEDLLAYHPASVFLQEEDLLAYHPTSVFLQEEDLLAYHPASVFLQEEDLLAYHPTSVFLQEEDLLAYHPASVFLQEEDLLAYHPASVFLQEEDLLGHHPTSVFLQEEDLLAYHPASVFLQEEDLLAYHAARQHDVITPPPNPRPNPLKTPFDLHLYKTLRSVGKNTHKIVISWCFTTKQKSRNMEKLGPSGRWPLKQHVLNCITETFFNMVPSNHYLHVHPNGWQPYEHRIVYGTYPGDFCGRLTIRMPSLENRPY